MKKFEFLKPNESRWRKPTGEKMEIEHVDEPDLLRGTFPYSEIPKIEFDMIDVPLDPPDDIWVTCTTFRDGQQARPPYTPKQIADLYDMLHRLGGPNGFVRQCEFFLYSDKDKEALRMCQEKGHEYPEITGWIRAVKADFQLVKEMGLKETGILTSSSDYHTFLKLGKGREKAMEGYLNLVRDAIEAGVLPRCHFEDITRADIYGFIIPYAQKLMDLSQETGVPIKVRLCDTMGYGVTYPGAALPRSVPKLVHAMIHDAGVPKEQLEWHGHNDFHKVHINAATAWLYGCAAANSTLMGYGERCGNPPIEGAAIEYISLVGDTNGIDTTVITEIAEYLQKECNFPIPPNYPFVGRDFNVTRAGIHADGSIKNEEIYNIFDTCKILNRPLGVAITDKSGVAGIAWCLNDYLKLEDGKKLSKSDPGVLKIHNWVDEQYKGKRVSAISTDELIEQAKNHLSEYF